MGRKQRFFSLFCGFLLFFTLTLLFPKSILASDDLRVYVRVLPEKPNATDGWFWQGDNVRVEFEIRNLKFEKIEQTNEVKSLKVKYSWDNLDVDRAVDYTNSFQPIEGEHWVFAWALNSDGNYATPATRFYMQFHLVPQTTPSIYRQQVSVNQDYLSWGNPAFAKSFGEAKEGQITAEAASTSKVLSLTPTPTPQNSLQSKFLKLLTGQKNIWIFLLVVGLFLLVVVKLVFRGGNREKSDIIKK